MSEDHVSRQEFSELVANLKELVIELKHTNQTNEEVKRQQIEHEQRIRAMENWMASTTVTIDEIKQTKKFITGSLISHIGTLITVAAFAAYAMKSTGG